MGGWYWYLAMVSQAVQAAKALNSHLFPGSCFPRSDFCFVSKDLAAASSGEGVRKDEAESSSERSSTLSEDGFWAPVDANLLTHGGTALRGNWLRRNDPARRAPSREQAMVCGAVVVGTIVVVARASSRGGNFPRGVVVVPAPQPVLGADVAGAGDGCGGAPLR